MRIGQREFCATAGLAVLAFGASVSQALSVQQPLDPAAFASIGSLSGNTYTINTGNGTSTPTISFPTFMGGTTLNGVISNGVAVYDFDSINVDAGGSITSSGALPFAILSRSSATFASSIDASANGVIGGAGGGAGGGFGGTGSFTGAGPGGGGLDSGGSYGGMGGSPNGGAKPPYSDPTHAFFGGSGGGAGSSLLQNGGGGGGAFEISALGDITISGTSLSADGSEAADAAAMNGAGGGSGGGILLATPGQIALTNSALIATGGGSDIDVGGGGGGGRILLETANFVQTGSSRVNVGGAAAIFIGITPPDTIGTNGSFDVTGYVAPLPEPASIALIALAAPMVARRRRSR